MNEDRIGIERVAEVTSYNTARIFGIYPKKGTIEPGSDADLTIVDLDLEKTVTPDLLAVGPLIIPFTMVGSCGAGLS